MFLRSYTLLDSGLQTTQVHCTRNNLLMPKVVVMIYLGHSRQSPHRKLFQSLPGMSHRILAPCQAHYALSSFKHSYATPEYAVSHSLLSSFEGLHQRHSSVLGSAEMQLHYFSRRKQKQSYYLFIQKTYMPPVPKEGHSPGHGAAQKNSRRRLISSHMPGLQN